MADRLAGPVSQSSTVKPTLPMGVITLYVIVVGSQGFLCPCTARSVSHQSVYPTIWGSDRSVYRTAPYIYLADWIATVNRSGGMACPAARSSLPGSFPTKLHNR
ncbi:hypothetical protein ElyMa_001772700 [Elysia marginata]|uniref:Uncharacterized protein n=1 Tax=Elysia marginata TaxID=1093978 RepID=A0AAV4ECW4_9GAST|nr:hypothetical protein ElyMa_001772700 [Elysia marginata]